MSPLNRILASFLLIALPSCSSHNTAITSSSAASGPSVDYFGATTDRDVVQKFTIRNSKGASASFISYGASITSLSVPDKDGKFGDVVLGYDSFRQYELSVPSMCNVVGRFANRIANGTFSIDNVEYHTTMNQGTNTLHGGFKGIGKRNWKGDAGNSPSGPTVRFTILDPDGAEGFPGNLKITVLYTLTDDNTLKVQFYATTDKPTPINLSQHAFFNLSGTGTSDVLGYVTKMYAPRYTPFNAAQIPTGKIDPVASSPFDFVKAKTIGQDQKALPGNPPGYDHTWVLDKKEGEFTKAIEIYDPASGRQMECWTTEPAIHLTSGKNMAGVTGKNGQLYTAYRGFSVETQHISDSPNRPEFPTTILRPGQTYRQYTEYRFTIPAKPLQIGD